MDEIYPLTLYFDGACRLCATEMRALETRDTHGQLRFVDISKPDFADYPPGTDRAALMTLMHARKANGEVLCGVEVFRVAYTAVGLPWVARLTRLPGLRALSETLYPLIARNRYSLAGTPFRWLFDLSLRRAAARSARRLHCDGDQCRIVPPERS